jgi:hypothetical protein
MSVIALLGKETTPPRRQQDVIAYVIAAVGMAGGQGELAVTKDQAEWGETFSSIGFLRQHAVSSSHFRWTSLTGGVSVRGRVCFCWVRIVFNSLNSYSIDIKFSQYHTCFFPETLGQKRFVLAAKTGFRWRARHPPATLSQ